LFLLLQPLPAHKNTILEFSDETVGTNVPKQYIPGVEKGFKAMCEKGLLSGHRIIGVKFRLIDGGHHCVDSSEFAFFQAAQGAIRDIFETGSWQILEPIMLVEVTGPEEFQVYI
jgi:elongation factor G